MKSTKISYKKCKKLRNSLDTFASSLLRPLKFPEPSVQGCLRIFFHLIVFQIHSYSSFIFFASPSTSSMAVCAGGRDLSLLDHCCQLPLQAWFASFRNGLLPNRNRFTDFKQLRAGSRKSFYRFTQPLLAHQITKVFISKQCEMSWPFKANHMRNSLRKFRMTCSPRGPWQIKQNQCSHRDVSYCFRANYEEPQCVTPFLLLGLHWLEDRKKG